MTRSAVWLAVLALMTGAVAACTAPAAPRAVAVSEAVVPDTPRGRDLAPEARARCLAEGGFVQRAGMMGYEGCWRRFKDGGKTCTDGGQCLAGRCDYKGKGDETKNDLVGRCAADNIPFGCRQSLTNGRIGQSICVD